jgi:hypothetical protein
MILSENRYPLFGIMLWPSQNLSNCCPHPRPDRGVANPVMRATAPCKCAPTDERLGMNGGDPVCRLFQLSLSGFRSLLGLRCQPLGAELLKSLLRAFKAARRHHLGPIPWPQASRFRPIFQVLFCRGQSAFLPGPNASRSYPFPCNEGAWRPIKVGLR